MRRIVITGPESTGKSILASQLSVHYKGICVPEYARRYFEERKSYDYRAEDVEHIARMQYSEYLKHADSSEAMVFFDTYLVITKVWFEWVFGFVPIWLHRAITESQIDLYLLCDTDIDWTPDNLRTNGGEKRKHLFQHYRDELDYYKKKYVVISGLGEQRLANAIEAIDFNISD